MNFTTEHVAELRSVLATCKAVGIDSIVLADKKVMGANEKRTLAIISECPIVVDSDCKIGIGRISELLKRIELFDEVLTVDAKEGARGDVVQLTLSSGRTKAQYRCTATSMIPHPKENADTPVAVVTLTKEEASTLNKAIKSFGADSAVIKIASAGDVHIECVDSTNDQFSTVLSRPAEFVGEAENVLFTYAAGNLSTVLDVGARDVETMELVFGESGSITALVKGRSVVIIPNANED